MSTKQAAGKGNYSVALTSDTDYQNLLNRIAHTYREGQQRAYQAVNAQLTETYWKIGHDIVECEQGGKSQTVYGSALLNNLSRDLSLRLGKGFSRSNLIRFRQFYHDFPIRAILSHKLSWSHIVELLMCPMNIIQPLIETNPETNIVR